MRKKDRNRVSASVVSTIESRLRRVDNLDPVGSSYLGSMKIDVD